MVSRIIDPCDCHFMKFGKGFVLLWIVACMGCPQQPATQDPPVATPVTEPTQTKEAPVSTKPELSPKKIGPVTPVIPPVPPQNARVRELQEERLKVCQELVEVVELQFQHGGRTDVDAVWQAREHLLEAQLDLSESKADRIRVHQERVQGMEAWHKIAKARFEQGATSSTEELWVRSNLLKAQIALEKEKSLPE